MSLEILKPYQMEKYLQNFKPFPKTLMYGQPYQPLCELAVPLDRDTLAAKSCQGARHLRASREYGLNKFEGRLSTVLRVPTCHHRSQRGIS